MTVIRNLFSFFLILWLGMNSAGAQDIHLAVASNFIAPMKEIIASFEARYSDRVVLSTGSSGKLYAQIRHGAPFHLLFSADQDKPRRLLEEQLGVEGSRFTYAIGKLVVIASAQDGISSQKTLKELIQQPGVSKIALANPRLAPYGRAADEVLGNLGLRDSTRSMRVIGENIAQTYQFVSTGNADIGFVALSQVIGDSHHRTGSYLRVSESLYSDIRQDAVLLNRAEGNTSVNRFLAFVKSQTSRNIIESFGYGIPPAKE